MGVAEARDVPRAPADDRRAIARGPLRTVTAPAHDAQGRGALQSTRGSLYDERRSSAYTRFASSIDSPRMK